MIIIREKKQPFNEKLEPATKKQFDLLQNQIVTDPETRRMLTSPMKEIPQYYWLYSDETMYAEEYSLFSILKFFVQENKGTLLFSKTNTGIFVGFIVYIDKGREITGIKTASFFDDRKKSNPQLAFDLIMNFLEQEIIRRGRIEWQADKGNRYANEQYVKLLNKKKFIWNRTDGKTGKMWVYTVTGKYT
jgi:hypothetical protein